MSSGSSAGWRAFPLQLIFPLTPLFPNSSTNICTSTWQRRYGLCSHCHTCSADNSAQAFCVGTEQHRSFSQHFPTQTSGMNKQFHLHPAGHKQAAKPTSRTSAIASPGTLTFSTAQDKSIQLKSPWLRVPW